MYVYIHTYIHIYVLFCLSAAPAAGRGVIARVRVSDRITLTITITITMFTGATRSRHWARVLLIVSDGQSTSGPGRARHLRSCKLQKPQAVRS